MPLNPFLSISLAIDCPNAVHHKTLSLGDFDPALVLGDMQHLVWQQPQSLHFFQPVLIFNTALKRDPIYLHPFFGGMPFGQPLFCFHYSIHC
jgi:hypothetical protein